jgi:hypothetical protein
MVLNTAILKIHKNKSFKLRRVCRFGDTLYMLILSSNVPSPSTVYITVEMAQLRI